MDLAIIAVQCSLGTTPGEFVAPWRRVNAAGATATTQLLGLVIPGVAPSTADAGFLCLMPIDML
jgi:hypothetical protein